MDIMVDKMINFSSKPQNDFQVWSQNIKATTPITAIDPGKASIFEAEIHLGKIFIDGIVPNGRDPENSQKQKDLNIRRRKRDGDVLFKRNRSVFKTFEKLKLDKAKKLRKNKERTVKRKDERESAKRSTSVNNTAKLKRKAARARHPLSMKGVDAFLKLSTERQKFGYGYRYTSQQHKEHILMNRADSIRMKNKKIFNRTLETGIDNLQNLIERKNTSKAEKFGRYIDSFLSNIKTLLQHQLNNKHLKYMRYVADKRVVEYLITMVKGSDMKNPGKLIVGGSQFGKFVGSPIIRKLIKATDSFVIDEFKTTVNQGCCCGFGKCEAINCNKFEGDLDLPTRLEDLRLQDLKINNQVHLDYFEKLCIKFGASAEVLKEFIQEDSSHIYYQHLKKSKEKTSESLDYVDETGIETDDEDTLNFREVLSNFGGTFFFSFSF